MTESKHNTPTPAGWQATCPVCNSSTIFTDRDAFETHVNSHPKCGKCGQRFASKLELGSHSYGCHGQLND